MEFLTLNTGAQLPMIGFGTWGVCGEEGKRSILDALELGYRLVDTALMYKNHAMVGAALRESGLPRAELFLTTKLNRPCSSYPAAKAGIEQCLNELQTDYLDLLLIHEPYENALAMYQAMNEAVHSGTVRAIGISNFSPAEYEAFLTQCGVVPAVNQIESHVYHPQLGFRRALNEHGTQMQSWAPFTEGRKPIFSEPVLCEIGAAHDKSAAQVALRYLTQNGIAVIPKSVHRERMAQNLALFDFMLTPEELARIRQLDLGASLFGWY